MPACRFLLLNLQFGRQQAVKSNNLFMLDTGSFMDAHGRLMKALRWTELVSKVVPPLASPPPTRCFSSHSFISFCIIYFVMPGRPFIPFSFVRCYLHLFFLAVQWKYTHGNTQYTWEMYCIYNYIACSFTINTFIFNLSQGEFEMSPQRLELITRGALYWNWTEIMRKKPKLQLTSGPNRTTDIFRIPPGCQTQSNVELPSYEHWLLFLLSP